MWAILNSPGAGVVQQVLTTDPSDMFHSDLIKVCPATTQVGDLFDGTTFSHPLAPEPTLADRLAALAAERYARQTAGVYFKAAGATTASPVASDPTSASMITSSFVAAQGGHWQDGTPWKMADGNFVPLTSADMQALALAILSYISGCFAREAELAAALAKDLTTDITKGWPINGAPNVTVS